MNQLRRDLDNTIGRFMDDEDERNKNLMTPTDTRAALDAAGPRSGIEIPVLDQVAQDHFRSQYKVTPGGRWLWTGNLTHGYGRFSIKSKRYRAHRISYTLHKGAIPKGMTLDHLCRVRGCVNPAHLEVTSMRENTLRGVSPTAVNAQKTHCKHGHEFNERNTYTLKRNGTYRRKCRPCALAFYHRAKSEARYAE